MVSRLPSSRDNQKLAALWSGWRSAGADPNGLPTIPTGFIGIVVWHGQHSEYELEIRRITWEGYLARIYGIQYELVRCSTTLDVAGTVQVISVPAPKKPTNQPFEYETTLDLQRRKKYC